MTGIQDVQCIQEGTTDIWVFKTKGTKKGPGEKTKYPFYNPSMELDRDLSILMVQWLVNMSKPCVSILDGLAASGIRGIRFSNEVEGNFTVFINDWNNSANSLIKKNVDFHSDLKNIVIFHENLNVLVSRKRFHYIDIDPFGTPVSFIDAALRSIYNEGIIACTATDTATLCGIYPKVCLRRYGSIYPRSYLMHEIGLRILIGFICREAGKYGKGIEPILSYTFDHYYRIYLRIREGIQHTHESIDKLSYGIPKKMIFTSTTNRTTAIGPLWTGNIHVKNVIQELRTILSQKTLNMKSRLWKLLNIFEEEADYPPFFYTMDNLASSLKISAPKMNTMFEELTRKGYKAVRTQFSSTGFKTDAPQKVVIATFKRKGRK